VRIDNDDGYDINFGDDDDDDDDDDNDNNNEGDIGGSDGTLHIHHPISILLSIHI
jgi:hypothetical protein